MVNQNQEQSYQVQTKEKLEEVQKEDHFLENNFSLTELKMDLQQGLDVTVDEIDRFTIRNAMAAEQTGKVVEQDYVRIRQEENFGLINYQCTNVEDLFIRLNEIDPTKLKQFLRHGFYDQKVMEIISCLVQCIWLAQNVHLEPHWRIRQWITNLRYLSQGAYGVTYLAAFDQVQEIVLKTNRPGSDNLNHEIFVGLFGTNQLRSLTLGFAFSYGGFNCSGSYRTGLVETWCQNSCSNANPGAECQQTLSYSLSERINGRTLYDYIKGFDSNQFYLCFLQVLFSLQTAYEQISFTHYDLHDMNIVIRELDQIYRVRYKLRNMEYLVSTNAIPTIIDFGIAYIKLGEKSYSEFNPKLYQLLGTTDKPFPLYDAYKLLLSILLHSLEFRNEAVTKVPPRS